MFLYKKYIFTNSKVRAFKVLAFLFVKMIPEEFYGKNERTWAGGFGTE